MCAVKAVYISPTLLILPILFSLSPARGRCIIDGVLSGAMFPGFETRAIYKPDHIHHIQNERWQKVAPLHQIRRSSSGRIK